MISDSDVIRLTLPGPPNAVDGGDAYPHEYRPRSTVAECIPRKQSQTIIKEGHLFV
jgi:hypothetical protein